MTYRSDSAVRRRSRFTSCVKVLGAALCCAGMFSSGAAKADDDFLRGSLFPGFSSQSYRDWSGVNFGVTLGRSNSSADFGGGSSDLIAYILRNTTIENEAHVSTWTTAGRATASGNSYGAFLGYNYEIEPKLYIGVDATYTRFSSVLSTSYTDALARSYTTSDSYNYNVNLNTSNAIVVKDYATLRSRFGYSVGQFLPYAFLGAALARVDVQRSATVGLSATYVGGGGLPNIPYSTQTQTDNRSTFAYGLVAGIGADVMILPNTFLRAEYEFVQFAPVNGIKSNLQTGRIGLGVKF